MVARNFRRRDADVAGKRVRRLLADRRRLRLPAETAERGEAGGIVVHQGRLAGDSVVVGIVRIGQRENVGRMDRLDETEADHLRRHARRQRRVGIERAEGEVLHAVLRLAQREAGAVLQRHRHLGVADRHLAFGGEPGHCEILQLAAIDRIREVERRMVGDLGAFLVGARHAPQSQEHRRRVGIAFRRMPAAVLQVTALAGSRVEQWAEAVGGLRRGWRRNPELAEQRVAELERRLLLEAQVGRELRERVLVGSLARGSSPAGHWLERPRPWRNPSSGR